MDKFRIDSHKAIYHPDRTNIITQYINNPKDPDHLQSYIEMMPLYVEVSPVGACNHRCTFCSVDYIGYKSNMLNPEVYSVAMDMSSSRFPIKAVMFAGEGEPLLHPKIESFLVTNQSNDIESAFTTNAVKLTPERLPSIIPYSSWIKVSCNAGTRDTYASVHRTSPNDFDIVWENLRAAVLYKESLGHNCTIGAQAVLIPDNSDSIFDLALRARDTGLDYVVIKPYSQHTSSTNRSYSALKYDDYLCFDEKLSSLNSDKFSVIFRKNTFANTLSTQPHNYQKCYSTPSLWGYIMANGDVYSCSAYLLDQRFCLGNISNTTFKDIWSSNNRILHSRFILDELDIKECRVNCRMNSVNTYLSELIDQTVPHRNFV